MSGAAPSPGALQGLILSSQAMLLTLGPVVLVPILPLILDEYRGEAGIEFWGALLVTVPSLCIALFSILAGVLGNRVGRRRLLLAALFAYCVCGLAPVVVRDFSTLFASRVALGIAQAVIVTISATLIGDYFAGRERDRWLAAISLFASLAGIAGVAASGWIAGQFGWRTAFWLYGLGLLYLPLMLLFTREPVVSPLAASSRPSIPWRFLASVCVVTLLGGTLFYAATVQIGRAFAAFGFGGAARTGLWIAIASVGVPVGAVLFSVLPKLSPRLQLSLVFVIFGVAFVALSLVRLESLFILAAFVSLVAAGVLMPTLISWTIGGLAAEVRGICIGIFQSVFALSSFCSGLVIAALAARFGDVLMAFAVVGWCAVGLGGLALMRDRVVGR